MSWVQLSLTGNDKRGRKSEDCKSTVAISTPAVSSLLTSKVESLHVDISKLAQHSAETDNVRGVSPKHLGVCQGLTLFCGSGCC